MQGAVLPIFLFVVCSLGLAVALLVMGNVLIPRRRGPVKQMPYESGMDPIHDTRRRFDVRFHLMAIAFLVFDVELLFLYPWAVTARPAAMAVSPPTQTVFEESPLNEPTATLDETAVALKHSAAGKDLLQRRGVVFPAVMVFIGLLTLGFIYDWRKGVFRWR